MRVAFRVDSSSEIGTGHFARCSTLAEALRSQGADVTILSRTLVGDDFKFLESSGFEVIRLNVSRSTDRGMRHDDSPNMTWRNSIQEEDFCLSDKALSQKTNFDWLVIDHYGIDSQWESRMRKCTKRIMVIDDLANRKHDCDFLLDQNYYPNSISRYTNLVPNQCRMALGTGYALLDPRYAELRNNIKPLRESVKRIVVYFGGSAYKHLYELTIKAFQALQNNELELDIVLGQDGSNRLEIEKLIKESDNIRIHAGLPSLAPLLKHADLCIGGAGTTTWERCCLGLPTIVVTIARNQEELAKALHHDGLIDWIGDEDSVTSKDILKAIKSADNQISRLDMSQKCRDLVDGLGLHRIVAAMRIQNDTDLKIRPTTEIDERNYFRWVNDPDVKKFSFSGGAISKLEHRRWFRQRLGSSATKLFICEIGEAPAITIGQVRFEQFNEEWRINFSLDRAFRGLGLGKRLLDLSIQTLQDQIPECKLVAEVKAENWRSAHIFENLGFSRSISTDGAINVYRR